MSIRGRIALPLAVLLLAPAVASAQEAQSCSDELEELEQAVQPAELNEQERAKYEQLIEAAHSFEETGSEQECLTTIESIRRILFIYPRTSDESGLADQAE